MCESVCVCVCVCWERQKRAEDGMRMEDIMAEWKIKTLPYAFPVQALRSLQFYAGRIHWEVHFFIVIFVGSAYFFPCLQRQQPHWVPCASARMCTQTLRINRNYRWTLRLQSKGFMRTFWCSSPSTGKGMGCGFIVQAWTPERNPESFSADAVSDAAKRQLEEMSRLFLKYQSDRN